MARQSARLPLEVMATGCMADQALSSVAVQGGSQEKGRAAGRVETSVVAVEWAALAVEASSAAGQPIGEASREVSSAAASAAERRAASSAGEGGV